MLAARKALASPTGSRGHTGPQVYLAVATQGAPSAHLIGYSPAEAAFYGLLQSGAATGSRQYPTISRDGRVAAYPGETTDSAVLIAVRSGGDWSLGPPIPAKAALDTLSLSPDASKLAGAMAVGTTTGGWNLDCTRSADGSYTVDVNNSVGTSGPRGTYYGADNRATFQVIHFSTAAQRARIAVPNPFAVLAPSSPAPGSQPVYGARSTSLGVCAAALVASPWWAVYKWGGGGSFSGQQISGRALSGTPTDLSVAPDGSAVAAVQGGDVHLFRVGSTTNWASTITLGDARTASWAGNGDLLLVVRASAPQLAAYAIDSSTLATTPVATGTLDTDGIRTVLGAEASGYVAP